MRSWHTSYMFFLPARGHQHQSNGLHKSPRLTLRPPQSVLFPGRLELPSSHVLLSCGAARGRVFSEHQLLVVSEQPGFAHVRPSSSTKSMRSCTRRPLGTCSKPSRLGASFDSPSRRRWAGKKQILEQWKVPDCGKTKNMMAEQEPLKIAKQRACPLFWILISVGPAFSIPPLSCTLRLSSCKNRRVLAKDMDTPQSLERPISMPHQGVQHVVDFHLPPPASSCYL